jgi:hypothetical protein
MKPLMHLYSTSKYHTYCLQLSIYAYMSGTRICTYTNG